MHQDRRLHVKPFWRGYYQAKSLFSTRWKIRKLLGTIIKSGIAWKIPSKRLALSVDVVSTSGPLKIVGMVDIPVKNAVANPPGVTRSYKLRCNRATSCFSIIGPRIFEDSLTVITRIPKQFPILRSRIPMVLMEIMVVSHGEEWGFNWNFLWGM